MNVIVPGALIFILVAGMVSSNVRADSDMNRKIDSLFVIASSGEVRFRDQNEPAMDSVAALGADAVPHLIEKFTTKSARERWTVIWILQRIGSAAVPDLVAALTRSDGLVVQRVCWALGDIKDSSSVEPLISVCTHNRWQVRDQAVSALGKIGDTRAEIAVIKSLVDSIGQVRKSAAVAAGKLMLSSTVDRLVHLLGDEFYGARMSAIASLLSLDSSVVLETVRDSIRSPNHFIGDLACQVLGKIGTDEAIQLLFEQTSSDIADRRAHAATALIKADPLDNCGFQQLLLQREPDRLVRMKIQSEINAVSNEHSRP